MTIRELRERVRAQPVAPDQGGEVELGPSLAKEVSSNARPPLDPPELTPKDVTGTAIVSSTKPTESDGSWLGLQASQKAHAVTGVEALDGGVDATHWGAMWGGLLGKALAPEVSAALDVMARAGLVDTGVEEMFKARLSMATTRARAPWGWIRRIGAAFYLEQVRRGLVPGSDETDRALAVIGDAATGTDTTYRPILTSADGQIEELSYELLKRRFPDSVEALLDHHPHLYRVEDTPAYGELCRRLAERLGPFLEGVNLGAVMHHIGQAPPFLDGMVEHLGLDPRCYVGMDIPYSTSPIAVDCNRRRGFRTLTYEENQRQQSSPIDQIRRALAGPTRQFEDTKELAIKAHIEELLALHEKNGKPILLIDDGGSASKVIRKYFREQEGLFHIVEWTTRGIELYRKIDDPRSTLLSGAGSMPKTELEPAFIGDSVIENVVIHLKERLGDRMRGKHMLLVGNGNIGQGVTPVAEDAGVIVQVYDKDREQRRKAGRRAVDDLEKAIGGQDVILCATGTNSMPPELVRKADSGTLVMSASSNDVETQSKNPRDNGTWEIGMTRVRLRVSADARIDETEWRERLARCRPADAEQLKMMRRIYTEQFRKLGLHIAFDFVDIARGGFPINLNGCLQTMPLARQELILMNTLQALAELVDPSNALHRGENPMRPDSENEVVEIYSAHHPKEYGRARAHQQALARGR